MYKVFYFYFYFFKGEYVDIFCFNSFDINRIEIDWYHSRKLTSLSHFKYKIIFWASFSIFMVQGLVYSTTLLLPPPSISGNGGAIDMRVVLASNRKVPFIFFVDLVLKYVNLCRSSSIHLFFDFNFNGLSGCDFFFDVE